MKKFSVLISVAITLCVFAGVHFTWLYRADSGNPASRRISIKVMPGATFKAVQDELVDKGIVTRPNVFRWAAWLTRRETKIKSGKYLFRQGQSVASVLEKLVSGEIDHFRVVIPEGLMVTEIASVLQREAEVDSALVVEAASDSSFLAELGIDAPSLEGYLFPDTYMFEWPLDERSALSRMVHRFGRVYRQVVGTLPDSVGLSMNEIVTLASIVQAEAVFDSEMPRISAVYHNRLKADWRLEADPTVAYALGGVKRRLWYKDLKVDSPYNTYKVRGLPPGPICSPGQAALDAAANPQPGSLDFYFVADGRGYHVFSKTYFDHLKAKHQLKYGTVPEQMKQKSYFEASGEDEKVAGGKAAGNGPAVERKQTGTGDGNREDDSEQP
ncbi:MAG TPA: endolytic transglycosylase MltG [Candidatus Krumholzibacterium sp.]|nr:endolytic transglycosylase MltG [Candidatus Krumholzibacterium sp.]